MDIFNKKKIKKLEDEFILQLKIVLQKLDYLEKDIISLSKKKDCFSIQDAIPENLVITELNEAVNALVKYLKVKGQYKEVDDPMKNKVIKQQKIYNQLEIFENGGIKNIILKEREFLLGKSGLNGWEYYKDLQGNFILETYFKK